MIERIYEENAALFEIEQFWENGAYALYQTHMTPFS